MESIQYKKGAQKERTQQAKDKVYPKLLPMARSKALAFLLGLVFFWCWGLNPALCMLSMCRIKATRRLVVCSIHMCFGTLYARVLRQMCLA